MAATPFRAVSWQPNEIVSDAKMDQVANNAQWLFENKTSATYNAHGVRRVVGLKIAFGMMLFTASKLGTQERTAYFGNYFSSACHPIVVLTPVTFQLRTFAVVNGIGVLHPDHRGFQCQVACYTYMNKLQIERNFYVNWYAGGF